jgi:hypothetical protein
MFKFGKPKKVQPLRSKTTKTKRNETMDAKIKDVNDLNGQAAGNEEMDAKIEDVNGQAVGNEEMDAKIEDVNGQAAGKIKDVNDLNGQAAGNEEMDATIDDVNGQAAGKIKDVNDLNGQAAGNEEMDATIDDVNGKAAGNEEINVKIEEVNGQAAGNEEMDAKIEEETKDVHTPAGKRKSSGGVEEDVIQRLKSMGFYAHLRSWQGSSLSPEDAQTATGRVAKWLIWTHQKVATGSTSPLLGMFCERFAQTIKKDYKTLGDYALYLEQTKRYQASTINNHLYDITRAVMWFTTGDQNEGILTPADLLGFDFVVKNLHKKYYKATNRQRVGNTMATEVYLRHQPAGGLKEMQAAFVPELEKLKEFLKQEPLVITREDFLWFTGMLYTSFYIFSVQGRISGLESLTVDQYDDFEDEGHAATTNFKTVVKYRFQLVSIGSVTYYLLSTHRDVFRPIAASHFRSSPAHPTPTDLMFITWEGKPDDPGTKITQWIKRYMGLNMSSTDLRKLVETTVNQLLKKGKISGEAAAACNSINGHTGQVAMDFYTLEDRTREIHLAREVLGPAMFNTGINVLNIPEQPLSVQLPIRTSYASYPSDSDSDEAADVGIGNLRSERDSVGAADIRDVGSGMLRPNPAATMSDSGFGLNIPNPTSRISAAPTESGPDPTRLAYYENILPITLPHWKARDTLKAADWGTDHPAYGKMETEKANWTEKEIAYIVTWCERAVRENSDAKKTVVAKCLKAIEKDPEAIKIFHKRHVLGSDRLRAGYRMAIKRGLFSQYFISVSED